MKIHKIKKKKLPSENRLGAETVNFFFLFFIFFKFIVKHQNYYMNIKVKDNWGFENQLSKPISKTLVLEINLQSFSIVTQWKCTINIT